MALYKQVFAITIGTTHILPVSDGCLAEVYVVLSAMGHQNCCTDGQISYAVRIVLPLVSLDALFNGLKGRVGLLPSELPIWS